MKLIATGLIAAIASVALMNAASAAPRTAPIVTPVHASAQMVTIRHNYLKLRIRVQPPSLAR